MKQNSLEQRSMDGYEKTEAGQTVRKQVELVSLAEEVPDWQLPLQQRSRG